MDANAVDSQLANASQSTPGLLILLVDSLRWDAPQEYSLRSNKSLPGFTKLTTGGAYVDAIRPVFPAECFPNIFSLFSGRYPADHGAIFNELYNETDNATYSFHNWTGYEKLSNLGIDNLFSAALTQTKRVHLFNLPPACSHPAYAGVYCEEDSAVHSTHARSQSERLRQTLDKALVGLRNGSADMAVVYFDELDRIGHRHGPLSDELLLHTLPKLDSVLDDLIRRLDASPTPINLLVTSDHGMTDVKRSEYLDRTISPALVKKVINRGSTVSIWPLPDEHHKVHYRLTERSPGIFTVYNRTNLPADWRTGGPFFPPILLVNRPGVFSASLHWPFSAEPTPKGLHGYPADLADMHVPLFVYGPGAQSGRRLSVDRRLDHLHTHAVISHLLGLNPVESLSSHSGGMPLQPLLTFEHTRFEYTAETLLVLLITVALAFLLVLALTLTFVCIYRLRHPFTPPCASRDLTEKLLEENYDYDDNSALYP